MESVKGSFGTAPLQGHLVMGQDQDFPLGGFSVTQMFIGKISEPSIWLEKIDLDVATQDFLTHSNYSLFEKRVHFNWTLAANASLAETPFCDLHKSSSQIIIPQKLSFYKAVNVCHELDMNVTAPKDSSEKKKIQVKTTPLFCVAEYYPTNTVWLGYIRKNFSTNSWYTIYGEQVDYFEDPFYPKDFDYKVLEASGQMFSENNQIAACIICTVSSNLAPAVVYLQGLCSFDIKFMVQSYANGWLMFVSNKAIVIKREENNWVLKYIVTNDTIGTLDATLFFPLGRHTWTLYEIECKDLPNDLVMKTEPANKQLVLTKCSNDHFTCTDGTCIPMVKRCTGAFDCKDRSDEFNCSYVDISEENKNRLPPLDPFQLQVYTWILKVILLLTLISEKRDDLIIDDY